MALLSDKARFRTLVAPYLKVLKTRFSEISGQFIGSADTYAGLPATDIEGSTVDIGDVASLTQADGGYASGIYRWDGVQYVLFQEFDNLDEIVTSMKATLAEVEAGIVDDKFITPATATQVYARLHGNSGNKFSAARAEEATDEAVTANAFTERASPSLSLERTIVSRVRMVS